MFVIWLGALLFLGGIVFTAAQAISRGRLSGLRFRSGTTENTLEPPERGGRPWTLSLTEDDDRA